MKTINISFSSRTEDVLKSLTGKSLEFVQCDPFSFNNWVYQRVVLRIKGQMYWLTNRTHPVDYYGAEEDICYLEFFAAGDEKIASGLAETEFIDMPFNETIREIQVIKENQQLFVDEQQTYDVHLIRGLVFVLSDGREIGFEKVDPFSEQIAVTRGHNLASQISSHIPTDDFEGNAELKIFREIISITA